MMEKLEAMVHHAKIAGDAILSRRDTVRVLSHYDADGIASAAIMAKALMRAERRFHLTLVKQVSEDMLSSLASGNPGLVVFLDMGAGSLDAIGRHLGSADVIIIDHHQQEGSLGPRMLHVNPMDFGIKEDMSGSGAAYIVARSMSAQNRDLAGTAIIGAIGDSQMGSLGKEWGLFGLNSEILKDAVETRKIRVEKGLRLWGRYGRPLHKALAFSVDPHIPNVSGSESMAVQFLNELGIELKRENGDWRSLSDLSEEEQKRLASGIIAERVKAGHPNAEWIFGDVYELLDKGSDCRDGNEFATLLNACGKMGRGYLGVELCLNVPKSFLEAKWVMEKYRRTVGNAVRWVSEQIEKGNGAVFRKTASAWYVLAGNRVGEHIISNVISIIEKSMDIGKPVFAFANAEDGVKVSARASAELVEAGLNLKKLVHAAALRVGGQGGGHSGAAGATIPEGSIEGFIAALEDAMAKKEKTNKSMDKEKNIKPNPHPFNSVKADVNGSTAAEEENGKENLGEEVEGKGLVQYFRS